MEKIKTFSPVVLRIGIALMFMWFGINQFTDTNAWTAYIPTGISTLLSLSPETLVHLNGIFEIIFGSALLLGFYTRFVAFFLAFHLIDITLIVGLDSIGMRDVGLSVATTVIWMNGADFFTLDRFIKNAVSS